MMNVIDEIAERYKNLQHLPLPATVAWKAVRDVLREHGYVIVLRSIYERLCALPEEVTDDDAPRP